MPRHLFVFLFALGLLVSCSPKAVVATQQPTAPAAQSTSFAPTLSDTSLLWRITGPGLLGESFLYGTIHLIPEADYFLSNRVIAALNDSEEVVFEIDPRQMQDPMAMMRLMDKINMNDGVSLNDLLDADAYQVVADYFTQMGIPFMMLRRMKPLFLSAMVGQDMQAMQNGGMGGAGMKSYEMEMSELAKAAGKNISGLETMEFQLGLFDSIPYQAQATMLYDAVRKTQAGTDDGSQTELDRLVDMYKRKAVAEMAASVTEEAAGVARFEELLLTKRNKKWVPQIKSMSAAGPRLYAVGAAHLGGAKGVIALLRGEGLTVEPVY